MELLSETVAYENPFFSILDRHYRFPDGTEHHFFIRQEVDTCCVLPQTSDGKFVTVREFRAGPQEVLDGLPAGRVDDYSDPDLQIAAELLQETGYEGRIQKVGDMPASPYSTRRIHCYYATDCMKVADQELDPTEDIEVQLLNADELYQQLISGKSSSAAPGLLAWEWMKRDGVLLDVAE